jgi:hypothetical protein
MILCMAASRLIIRFGISPAVDEWVADGRPVVTVCSRPKLCAVFCVNNTVRTAGVLALNSGNYFLQVIHVLGALGEESYVCNVIL